MTAPMLILIGAGGECAHAISHAQSLGYRVLATDKDPDAVGARLADEFLPLCAYTPEETVAGLLEWKARGGKLGGVLCVAVDAPHTVAAVGQALGLPAISPQTAHLATDKLAMKDRLRAAGVAIPWYTPVRDAQDVQSAVEERGYPLIVKPVDSRGARGVLRIMPNVDIAWAFGVAQRESRTGRVMVEEFLDGQQVSTEGLMVNGVAHIPGFADRNYEYLERFAPHIIENGGDMPSTLPQAAQQAIKFLTGQAALTLGLEHGPVKGDMVWHNGQPYVIEIAARHSGGYFVTHEIPWNTGVDLLGASIRMAMGEIPTAEELTPIHNKGVCQRYIFPEPGHVVGVAGVENVLQIEGIRYVEVRVQPGDKVSPVRSHPNRAGVIMGVAKSRGEAQALVTQAIKQVNITMGNGKHDSYI